MWWEKTENGYHFFDGDEDIETHSEGPLLLHHRSVLLEEVRKQQRAAWKFILDHCRWACQLFILGRRNSSLTVVPLYVGTLVPAFATRLSPCLTDA